MDNLTQIINSEQRSLSSDEQKAVALIYSHLKKIAHAQKFKFSKNELNTTELVNEAWLKLYKNERLFNDRNHFYATSALAMRQILLNQAKKMTQSGQKVELTDQALITQQEEALWLLQMEKNLRKLADYAPRLEEVFVYRYFGGMSVGEIAQILETSERTINRDWKKAKLMLSVAMGKT